jgi:adenosylcobinamide-phosphate synthase
MSSRGRAILLAGALDAVFGDPRILHPVAGFGQVAQALESRLWAPSRGRGVLFAASLVVSAAVLGARARDRVFGEASVLWAALGCRSLVAAALQLARLVEAGELEAARQWAPTLIGRDPRSLDAGELCRGAVESVAENTADAVVGALLWHALLGPAGSSAYRAVNTLDAMVGHRSERYARFGWAAARLDDLLTGPAARLATALTVVLSGRGFEAWRCVRRDGRAHPSPNAGLLEAAFAGALGVQLGGTVRYGERVEHRPLLGVGKRPTPADIRRAVRLSLRVSLAGMAVAWAVAERLDR